MVGLEGFHFKRKKKKLAFQKIGNFTEPKKSNIPDINDQKVMPNVSPVLPSSPPSLCPHHVSPAIIPSNPTSL